MSKRTDEINERVRLSSSAKKFLDGTDTNTYARIKAALDGLALKPPKGTIKPLVGHKPLLRAVVGKYRIVFCVLDGFVNVSEIDSRGQVYNRL